ncbi:YigZ family protein [Sciscionella marina]|uniref:YigZ family protein n=1 Tax=Sciscionella marina TaxID=508770 RepID=UPI00037B8871|nr:YigZ family protein [Sciscionella marina]
MTIEGYRTIAAEGTHEIEERRSRFIAALAPVEDEEQARAFIARRRRAEPNARHHCHAFVIGVPQREQRSSDDGEPAGTAGVPILEVLLRAELTATVAVVSRYFGGIKLGAGGLVRAYGGAVAAAVEAVGTVWRRRLELIVVTVDHALAGKLEHDLRQSGYAVRETSYGRDAEIEVGVPVAERPRFEAWLAELTAGAARTTTLGEAWV